MHFYYREVKIELFQFLYLKVKETIVGILKRETYPFILRLSTFIDFFFQCEYKYTQRMDAQEKYFQSYRVDWLLNAQDFRY